MMETQRSSETSKPAGEEELAENTVVDLPQLKKETQKKHKQVPQAVAGEAGYQYEMKMAALIGLRALKEKKEFQLSSNRPDTGNFDDLVYTADQERYFLQLKHSDNSAKMLTKEFLVKLLDKYFKSYCDITNGENFKDIAIDNTHFIIYTNKKLDPSLSQYVGKTAKLDTIFKTNDEGIFHSGTKIPKFNDSEIPDHKNERTAFLEKVIIATSQKGHRDLDDLIAEEIRTSDKIQVCHQKYKLILHHFYEPLGTWWRNNENRENMTPEMLTTWLERAKNDYCASLVTCLYDSHMKKFVKTGIKFSGREIERLQTELSDKRTVYLKSDALTLCSKLLLDCLATSKCIFVNFECLRSHRDELLHAWLGGVWEWLIVSCDSTVQPTDISNTCKDIHGSITPVPSKKSFIIVTELSVEEIQNFSLISHKFKFEQLSQKSQKFVLDKKIDFQGCEVSMRSVLQQHGIVEDVLGPELVTDLITSETPVNIGGKLQVNKDYYANRVLERKVWLQLDVLRNPNSRPDIFALSGTTKEGLLDIVPSGENVENLYVGKRVKQSHYKTEDSRFIILPKEDTKTCFSNLCKKHREKTLHWVKFKNGNLLWKESRGGFNKLLNYIDTEKTRGDKEIIKDYMKNCESCDISEESIWDLKERTVLVVAEPGMGKSSTTTNVAWLTKKKNPTSWVVHVNCNDHTGKLAKLNADELNIESLSEFLCSASFPESKYININKSLLKHALQNSGNATVFMDGYDEITPTHASKIDVILRILMTTKVRNVWVTSRPIMGDKLEELLRIIPFTLKKLSQAFQERILQGIWEGKAKGDTNRKLLKKYIQYLLLRINNSVYPRNVTGYPLHIMMIANAFGQNLETSLRSREISLPSKLDLLFLYETFFEMKLRIYAAEKKGEDFTKASVQDDQKRLKELCMENLEKCSLFVILPDELNPLWHVEIESTSFLKNICKGEDKTGIVINVVEGKPLFVHRTFAEYFTALWFSKNFQSYRNVLAHILFDHSYGLVRDVFDRILSRDFPLHCAVLDWDTEAVETLLQEGSDANALDNGGRTAMHLVAAQLDDPRCEEITECLLKHGASLDIKDNVLFWSPLRYAKKTKNAYVMERLSTKMESGVH